uniref:Uncharacterized protein n=1 Tax=Gossypium raimondii TaxID=29730 RepID=A0A0D2SJ21_GOSRA|nr:hypothetical protein B456_007G250400 [Gossypium raimondii]
METRLLGIVENSSAVLRRVRNFGVKPTIESIVNKGVRYKLFNHGLSLENSSCDSLISLLKLSLSSTLPSPPLVPPILLYNP